jgi:hypothetical protein
MIDASVYKDLYNQMRYNLKHYWHEYLISMLLGIIVGLWLL